MHPEQRPWIDPPTEQLPRVQPGMYGGPPPRWVTPPAPGPVSIPVQQYAPPPPARPAGRGRKVAAWVVGGVAGLIVIAGLAGSRDDEPPSVTEVPVAAVQQPPAGVTAATPAEAPAPAPAPQPEVSASVANATDSARSYLSFTGFSRSGLIDQLEFEGYTTADATEAVDSLDVDYNAEAVESAESYLDFSSFSRSGLIDQLEFEGYTAEQAEYAVSQTYR